VKITIKEN
jgi:hypothetical protein